MVSKIASISCTSFNIIFHFQIFYFGFPELSRTEYPYVRARFFHSYSIRDEYLTQYVYGRGNLLVITEKISPLHLVLTEPNPPRTGRTIQATYTAPQTTGRQEHTRALAQRIVEAYDQRFRPCVSSEVARRMTRRHLE